MNESLESLKAYARKLVADYSANGLSGMSTADIELLFSEKQLHLGEVSERCARGENLLTNVLLKRGLEAQVREIGKGLER